MADTVLDEWIEALLRSRPDLTRERLERTRALMKAHTRDALVTGYEPLIEVLNLPDPNDRHVLAAAIRGRADVVVTTNLKDFPPEVLARWGIEAQHPDAFSTWLIDLAQPAFLEAVRTVRARPRNPPKSAEDYLQTLRAHGLGATVAALTPFTRFL
jgi:hypothetical protein